MVPIWYVTLSDVLRAADIPSSAHFAMRVSDVLTESVDAVHELCKRVFYPEIATREFPWPQQNPRGDSKSLALGYNELINVTTVTNGDGQSYAASGFSLSKEGGDDDGPPYNVLTADNIAFTTGNVGVLGLYGYRNDETAVTTTASGLSGTSVDVSDSSRLGVGSLIRIADERLVITRMGWLLSSNATAITLEALDADDSFDVTDGTAFNIGEMILIGAERMLIVDIVDDTLHVQRAVDGTVLAAHAAVTAVRVNRRLTVERAVLGTQSTDTAQGASVLLFRFPGLVRQLHKAEALQIIQQDAASYGTTSGSQQNEFQMSTRAMADLRQRCLQAHGRLRSGAV